MATADTATIQALRLDVAYQIARCAEKLGDSQLARARYLGIPQPTLSKIVNGRVSDLSLELLIRISVRAALPLTLQTGKVPEEAGAFTAMGAPVASRIRSSPSSEAAREMLLDSEQQLTPEQRLEAFLEHNQQMAELYAAGQTAESTRARVTPASARR